MARLQRFGYRPSIRHGKPESQKMAAALGFRPILILCSAVQHDQIIDELDVARLEIHFQLESWIVRERLHRVEGLVVERGQARGTEAKRWALRMNSGTKLIITCPCLGKKTGISYQGS